MPEIAEVETVRNVLKARILNKKIVDIKVLYPNMILNDIYNFRNSIINNEFKDIKRKGKWLIFEINNYYLLSHLRMEGKFFTKSKNDPIEKHEHIIFYFEDDTTLRYHDTRKFGKMKLIKHDELETTEEIAKQGIEPIDDSLTSEYLLDKFKGKTIAIKTSLLDQTIISGLGNIYVDEVLFAANINPLRKTNTITQSECDRIISSANRIIKKAIKEGGCTIKSYTSSLGVIGNYQNYLKVHQRKDELCLVCRTPIVKTVVNGRGTYYCPVCQK